MEQKIHTHISKDIRASGYIKQNNIFVILKGSFAVDDTELKPSFLDRPCYLAKRKELIATGKLKKGNHNYQFTEDVEFNTPSLAAIVIWGSRLNGIKIFGLKDDHEGGIPQDLLDLL